jgi:prepilin peptidase dependent protein D
MRLYRSKSTYQSGFTLFELMIAIAIIAILTAIGVPTYQGYIQKAALTDMLQMMSPYKTAVELCAFEQASLIGCNNGNKSIPTSRHSHYVEQITVTDGVITLTGKQTLLGLTAAIIPTFDPLSGQISWQRECSSSENSSLIEACHDLLRF